ncbi:hypothetical protein Tco_0642556 [Tanacetum coccineum]
MVVRLRWCVVRWWLSGGGGERGGAAVDGDDDDGGVTARGCGDWIDRLMKNTFGLGRKSPPKKFFGGGGGRRRWLAGNERGEGRAFV